jgi:hypothetical protein
MKTTHFKLQARFMEFCETNNINKQKYFINYADNRCGATAAIMERNIDHSVSLVGGSRYYTFDALIAWMDGYTTAKELCFLNNN